eukprot:16399951-Heterocapsa_arctica.AAC.1
MVRVLRDFRRRRISPASRHRRAAEWGGRQALVKRSSSARHVPGKGGWLETTGNQVVSGCTYVEQAPQKVVGLVNTTRTGTE